MQYTRSTRSYTLFHVTANNMLLLALVLITGAMSAPIEEPPPSRWSGSAPAIDMVSDRGSWRLPPAESRAPFVTSGREPPPYYREEPQRRVAPRRIVYYADLPDVGPKYTRQSRYEGPERRDLPYGRAPAPSYTIIDAELDGDRKHLPTTRGVEYSQAPLPDSRYNRIPAPYQPEYRRLPEADFRYQPSEPNYRRPPQKDYRRPLLQSNPETQPRRPESVGDERRLQQSGELYQRLPEDDPYHDYNPRQPAPWSMQIGARLTVKDDGRRPSAAGRRFYVQSQEPGTHYASVRYPPPRN